MMYILVNYSDDYGLEYCGKFTSHREAYEYLSDYVMEGCDNKFDIMSMYPIDDTYDVDSLRYRDNETEIFAGANWCTCHFRNYSDYYLIIEV